MAQKVSFPPPPPHGGHVFQQIKILRTRNNIVELFRILTSGFGEEYFLRISSCPYNAKSLFLSPLPPPGAMFFNGSKLRAQCLKGGHPRNNPVKLFKNRISGFREEDF